MRIIASVDSPESCADSGDRSEGSCFSCDGSEGSCCSRDGGEGCSFCSLLLSASEEIAPDILPLTVCAAALISPTTFSGIKPPNVVQ